MVALAPNQGGPMLAQHRSAMSWSSPTGQRTKESFDGASSADRHRVVGAETSAAPDRPRTIGQPA
jgi:hypothetical protein